MKSLIERFGQHLVEAMAIGEKTTFTKPAGELRNVLITGLGGSGIGGTIVAQLVAQECSVPVIVNKDYFLPGFADGHTLVIVSSYSGNTEETIAAFDAALERRARVCCISSGGKVVDMAREHGCDHVVIPGGLPPRAAFGYSFTQLLYVLQGYGLIGGGFRKDLEGAIALLQSGADGIKQAARRLAEQLLGRIPVIYSEADYEGVCIRFRQQINENAKMLCWHHVLPEMNHNELVGWTTPNDRLAVVFFRNSDDFARTQTRMEITGSIVKKYTPHVFEVYSKGKSPLEKTLYLVHFGDWVSWYLSELKQIDATEVKVIDYLKGELAGKQ